MSERHQLSVVDHDRAASGLTYVYTVVSRRAGGVSIGVNLNPNRACNFRCIYCQVPGLVRGSAPEIDLERLRREFGTLLADVVRGDYLERHAPPGDRVLKDVALSGDGEPTSCRVFDEVIAAIGEVLVANSLVGAVKLVLITNGSFVHRDEVQRGLTQMARLGGEVWFKIDGGTEERRKLVNDAVVHETTLLRNLVLASERCPLRVQTCVFTLDGDPPSEQECGAYLALLQRALDQGAKLRGVWLYGIARPSKQPEAPRLAKVDASWMRAFAARIASLGLEVGIRD